MTPIILPNPLLPYRSAEEISEDLRNRSRLYDAMHDRAVEAENRYMKAEATLAEAKKIAMEVADALDSAGRFSWNNGEYDSPGGSNRATAEENGALPGNDARTMSIEMNHPDATRLADELRKIRGP